MIETNRYGLSPSLAGETVQAKIYHDRIELYYEHRLLKTYGRSYERNAEKLDWTQYVGTLCKKPGAAEHTRFFHQMPALWQEHLKRVKGAERKSALMLLREIVDEGNESLCDETLAFAMECGRTDADSMKQCYYMLTRREKHPAPLKELDAPAFRYDPSLYVYDGLAGGEKRA